MISYYDVKITEDGKHYIEIACLTDDTKPSDNIANGSLALEIDTGDVYAFDEVGETWNKL